MWTTAKTQCGDRYLPESTAHQAKMLPAIAARAITAFTSRATSCLTRCAASAPPLRRRSSPGGTRSESSTNPAGPTWRANLAHAADLEAPGYGQVVIGDARNLPTLVAGDGISGKVALMVTSPSYGVSVHGQVRPSRDSGQAVLRKWDNRYSRDRSNLAHRGLDELVDGFQLILKGAFPLLRPGGTVAITVRSFRRHGRLIDFPEQIWTCAQEAGLEPVQRLVALLAGVRGDQLVPRGVVLSDDRPPVIGCRRS